MLVFTRRIGEKVIIIDGNNEIEITFLGVNGRQTRVGIAAPKEVIVHREEIWKRIQKEQQNLKVVGG